MGRGDRKTKKGKRFRGSFGKTRPRKERNRNSWNLNEGDQPKASNEEE